MQNTLDSPEEIVLHVLETSDPDVGLTGIEIYRMLQHTKHATPVPDILDALHVHEAHDRISARDRSVPRRYYLFSGRNTKRKNRPSPRPPYSTPKLVSAQIDVSVRTMCIHPDVLRSSASIPSYAEVVPIIQCKRVYSEPNVKPPYASVQAQKMSTLAQMPLELHK